MISNVFALLLHGNCFGRFQLYCDSLAKVLWISATASVRFLRILASVCSKSRLLEAVKNKIAQLIKICLSTNRVRIVVICRGNLVEFFGFIGGVKEP